MVLPARLSAAISLHLDICDKAIVTKKFAVFSLEDGYSSKYRA